MPRVIGIDPGFANMGIVGVEFNKGLDDVKVIHQSVVITAKAHKKRRIRKGSDDQRRHSYIYEHFSECLDKIKPHIVAMEAVSFVRNASTMCNIGGTWYGLYYLLLDRGIYVVDYTPQELKVVATGKKSASKEDMIQAVENLWPDQVNWNIVNKGRQDHMADAAIAAWAAIIDKEIPWNFMKS